MTAKKFRRGLAATLLLAVIAACGWTMLHRQAVLDWTKLRGYNPPAVVQALASDDTMTPKARHLFYVNHPDVTNGTAFTANCPSGSEKTVVLGCYIGNDTGIYVEQISDKRLNGVEQVTAAHEMLHAAYRRLSSGDRQEIDAELQNYYEHDLTDQRVKDVIAAYQKSEPNDVVNEMHSVFGTEVAHLPGPLEHYYAQYFTDRSKVTGYAAAYENEFTLRQQQVAAYDAQLSSLKGQIEADEQSLKDQASGLNTQQDQMNRDQSSGDYEAYNAMVPAYNAAVDRYRALTNTVKSLINQYNDIVTRRNGLVLEERQLVQAISPPSSVPPARQKE